MSKCEMLKLTKNHAVCDPSGFFGCPKAIRRDMITPECWRLRRFQAKEPAPVKQRVTRDMKVKCPRCKTRFPIREGLV